MVVVTKEIECIVQNNVRYCEKEEMSPREAGFALLFISLFLIVLVVYIITIVELDFKYNTKGKLPIIGFFAPILLIVLILII